MLQLDCRFLQPNCMRMENWKLALQTLADRKKPKEDFPLIGYEVHAPVSTPFPMDLPHSDEIIEFYKLCDGGMLGDYTWYQLDEIHERNSFWQMYLKDVYDNNLPPFYQAIHLVVAENSEEFPLIWDQSTNLIDIFDMNKYVWANSHLSFNNFMNELFDVEIQASQDDSWGMALIQLERML